MAEEKGPVQGLLDGLRENAQGVMKDFQARRVSMMAKRSDTTGGLMEKVKGIRGDRKILGSSSFKMGDYASKLGQGKILGEGGLKIGNGELLKKIPRPLGIIKFGTDEGNGNGNGNGDSGNGASGNGADSGGEAVDQSGAAKQADTGDAGQAFTATPKRVRGH